MADETVVISLKLDKGDASRLASELSSIGKSAGDKAGKSFGSGFGASVKKSISSFAPALIATNALSLAFRGLTNQIGQTIQRTRDFARNVAEVNSLLPANEKLTKKSTEALAAFGAQFGSGAAAQAKAYYSIVSAGVKGTTTRLNTLESANKAAVAGLVDINTAAFALVSSVNAYRRSGLTAKKASDALFAAVREGQTTFGELANSIGRVSPIASSVGIEFGTLTGILAEITKNGIKTDEAIVGLRQTILGIIKPSEELIKLGKNLGIQLGESGLKANGFSKTLEDIVKGAKKSGVSINKLFANIRAGVTVVAIANGGFDNLNKTLALTENSAGDTARAFKDIEKNADFQLTKLGTEIDAIVDKITAQFVPALLEMTTAVNAFFDAKRKSDIIEELKDINSEITTTEETLRELQQGDLNFGEFLLGKDLGDRAMEIEQVNEKLRDLKTLRAEMVADQQVEPEEEEGDGPVIEEEDEAPTIDFEAGLNAVDKMKKLTEGFRTSIIATGQTTEKVTAKMNKMFKETGKAFVNGFGKSIAAGFTAVGAALVKGENAFEAFGKAMIGVIGKTLIERGTAWILEGIGWSVNPATPGAGAGLIAAGAGMVIAGGAMGAIGGGGGGAAAPAESSATTISSGPSSFEDDELSEDFTSATSEPSQQVKVVIQGDVLDSDSTGLRIVELINQATDTMGATIRREAIV